MLGIVATDCTFERADIRGTPSWVGKCLHCNRKLVASLSGDTTATIEHCIPRNHGGGDELQNLAHGARATSRHRRATFTCLLPSFGRRRISTERRDAYGLADVPKGASSVAPWVATARGRLGRSRSSTMLRHRRRRGASHPTPRRSRRGSTDPRHGLRACENCNRQKGYRHDFKKPNDPRAREVIDALKARRMERWRDPNGGTEA